MKRIFGLIMILLMLNSCGEQSVTEYYQETTPTIEEDILSLDSVIQMSDNAIKVLSHKKKALDSLDSITHYQQDAQQRLRYELAKTHQVQQVTYVPDTMDSLIVNEVFKDTTIYNVNVVDTTIIHDVHVYDTIYEDVRIRRKKKKGN